MHAKRERRIGLIITLIGITLFVGIILVTFVWASGLKFNSTTRSFEQTAVIAVQNQISGVTVTLNGGVVGSATPITLNDLAAGNYNLVISKDGFHPFEQFFQLSAGEAGVVSQAVLVAQKPMTVATPGTTHQPRDPFDVGLSYQNNQLVDFDNLVSRFAAPIIQAHRFNNAYIYQQGDDIHILFTQSHQDFVVYHTSSPGILQMNLSPGNWSITVFDQTTPEQIFITKPSAALATS